MLYKQQDRPFEQQTPLIMRQWVDGIESPTKEGFEQVKSLIREQTALFEGPRLRRRLGQFAGRFDSVAPSGLL